MSQYTRYLIPPRSFYKSWLSHYDAFPLFAANALGGFVVLYFGFRKMFKHPDVAQPSNPVLDPLTESSFTEKNITQLDDWWKWFRNVSNATANLSMSPLNLFVLPQSSWMSNVLKVRPESDWDRVREFETPKEVLKRRSTIPPSPLQTMTAMKEVSPADRTLFDQELEEAESKKLKREMEIVQKLNEDPYFTNVRIDNKTNTTFQNLVFQELSQNTDVLKKQYELVALEMGIKEDSKFVDEYTRKLKSFGQGGGETLEEFKI